MTPQISSRLVHHCQLLGLLPLVARSSDLSGCSHRALHKFQPNEPRHHVASSRGHSSRSSRHACTMSSETFANVSLPQPTRPTIKTPAILSPANLFLPQAQGPGLRPGNPTDVNFAVALCPLPFLAIFDSLRCQSLLLTDFDVCHSMDQIVDAAVFTFRGITSTLNCRPPFSFGGMCKNRFSVAQPLARIL